MNVGRSKDLLNLAPRFEVVKKTVDDNKILRLTISVSKKISVKEHQQVLSFKLLKNSINASKIVLIGGRLITFDPIGKFLGFAKSDILGYGNRTRHTLTVKSTKWN